MLERGEIGRFEHERILAAQHLADGASDEHTPLLENGDVGADFLHFIEQMAGEDDGGTLVAQAADEFANVGDARRVETVGRFIEHEHAGSAEQRTADREALLHAERVGAEPALPPFRQADGREHAIVISGATALEPGGDAEVLVCVEVGIEVRCLEQRSDGAPCRRRFHVFKPLVSSGRRLQDIQHNAEQGSLAAAIGSEDAKDGAFRYAEGNPIERLDLPIALADVLEAEDEHARQAVWKRGRCKPNRRTQKAGRPIGGTQCERPRLEVCGALDECLRPGNGSRNLGVNLTSELEAQMAKRFSTEPSAKMNRKNR